MDAMNLLVLTCAVVAALALGVLLGYVCCQGLFELLKMHARSLRGATAVGRSTATDAAVPRVQPVG
jgi:hypothetical protein